MVHLSNRSVTDTISSPNFDELLHCMGEWRVKNQDAVVTGLNFYPEYREDDDNVPYVTTSIDSMEDNRTGGLVGTMSYDVPVGPDNGGY